MTSVEVIEAGLGSRFLRERRAGYYKKPAVSGGGYVVRTWPGRVAIGTVRRQGKRWAADVAGCALGVHPTLHAAAVQLVALRRFADEAIVDPKGPLMPPAKSIVDAF